VLSEVTGQRAEAVARSLEPDNVDFPEGLSLQIEANRDGLVIDFQARNGMAPLIASVDEVLEHVSVSLRVTE
jgi:hypothetical protein